MKGRKTMKIRVAIAGEIPDNKQLVGKIDLLFGEIKGHMTRTAGDAQINLLTCGMYTGENWKAWNSAHGFEELRFDPEGSENSSDRNMFGSGMCNASDIVVVVWNEDPREMGGAPWEMIRMAYDRKVPCVWLSSATGNIYCLWEAYYEKYSAKYLDEFLEPLPETPLAAAESKDPVSRIHTAWIKRRHRFLAKHNADNAVHDSVHDRLLDPQYPLETEYKDREPVRKVLLEKFGEFNETAIEYNVRYQSRLYQRSVLPIIATIFLAIGFYAETLIGETFHTVLPPITQIASIIAGLGFLIHACINLYAYKLSGSSIVAAQQKKFTVNRYTAEMLRVMVHFLPYGTFIDLRKLCAYDRKLFVKFLHIADDEEKPYVNNDTATTGHVLAHMKEMLSDQLEYHKASEARYRSIVEKLEKWGKIIFYIGFFMVLCRGLMQFALVLFPLGKLGEIDINKILKSLMNMLALMLPAWAGYFSTKLALNNFRYNYNNHSRMEKNIEKLIQKTDRLLGQENLSVEIADKLAEESAETLVSEDTAEWTRQYLNSGIKPL